MALTYRLPFEQEIAEAEAAISRLDVLGGASAETLRRMQADLVQLKKRVFSQLTPWQNVLVSRHPERPQFLDYVAMIFEDWIELHGDRAIGDDKALRTGFAKIGDYKVMLIGHHKGRTIQERTECFFGLAHPEGYRKALNRMKQAAKFGLPVIALIDTPGAYPGIGAEERGQAALIATNLLEMARLRTPIVCVITGEGGSGGALGIGVGDRIGMLEFAYYSVISPEGCAGILWKEGANEENKAKAASSLRLTSSHLAELKVIDDVILEPLGGAHRNQAEMGSTLKAYLLKRLRELVDKPLDKLVNQRYAKFRKMGVFTAENGAPAKPQTKTSAKSAVGRKHNVR